MKARKGCGGGDTDHDHTSGSAQRDLPRDVQEEIERADKDSRSVVIDLTQDDSDQEDEKGMFGNEEFVRKGGKKRMIDVDNEGGEEDKKPDLRREESPDLVIVSSTSNTTTTTGNSSKKKRSPSNLSATSSKRRPPPPSASSASSSSTSTDLFSPGGWSCPLCTYNNPRLHLCCSICHSERPRIPEIANSTSSTSTSSSASLPTAMTLKSITGTKKEVVMSRDDEYWICYECGEETEKMFWTCKSCGKVKTTS